MYIFWTILGVSFLILDYKKPHKIKLTLASTFLFTAIVAYKFNVELFQIIFIMLGLFAVFYILIDLIFKKENKDNVKSQKLSEYIGKTAIVKKDIGRTLSIDGLGYIEFENQLWTAKSIDDKFIKAGREVEIVSKENLIMNVKVK